MSAKGMIGDFFDPIDDYIVSQLIDVRRAASLTAEAMDILRANVRSEILHSDEIREILVKKVAKVTKDLSS